MKAEETNEEFGRRLYREHIARHSQDGRIYYWQNGGWHGTVQLLRVHDGKAIFRDTNKIVDSKIQVMDHEKFIDLYTKNSYYYVHQQGESWMHMHNNIGDIEPILARLLPEVEKIIKRLDKNAKRRNKRHEDQGVRHQVRA